MRLLKQSTAANVAVLMVLSSDRDTGATGLSTGGFTVSVSKDGSSFSTITPTITELGNGWYNLALTTTHTNTLGELLIHVTVSTADPYDEKCLVIAADLATTIENQVWNASRSSHTTSGTFGEGAASVQGNVAGSVGSVASGGITSASFATDAISSGALSSGAANKAADALLDRSLSGHNTTGTVGERLTVPTGTVVSDPGNTTATFKTNRTETIDDYFKDMYLEWTSGANIYQVKKVTGYTQSTKFITVSGGFTSTPAPGDTFNFINK